MEDIENEIVQNQKVTRDSERKLPRNKYTVLGVIESNGQIVRNESGQAKHKEFKEPYIPYEQRKRSVRGAGRDGNFDDIEVGLFGGNLETIWKVGWIMAILAAIWAFFGKK